MSELQNQPYLPPPSIPGYELLELLGEGGQGAVYRARQKSLDRVVAVKILAPRHAADRTRRKRFFAEAQLQSKLHHPNILQGIDVNHAEDIWYFVMEFVSGTDAHELLSQRGALPEVEVVEIARQIADALGYAHERGIVHGDIKPENIVISAEGAVKMVDFGIAKLARDGKQRGPLGTAGFMAPEIESGRSRGDVRSDLYSLGVTLYELLTGTLPPVARGQGVLGPDPRERAPRTSATFAEAIARLLARDPVQRFQTPRALLATIGPPANAAQKTTPLRPAAGARTRVSRPSQTPYWIAGLSILAVGFFLLRSSLMSSDEGPGVPEGDRSGSRPQNAEAAPVTPEPTEVTAAPAVPPPDTASPRAPEPGPAVAATAVPTLTFDPPSLEVPEGESMRVLVRVSNLGAAFHPLLRVLDEQGRDTSSTMIMPEVTPTDDPEQLALTWTAPFRPGHGRYAVSIMVSQSPVQASITVNILDRNRLPVGILPDEPLVVTEGGPPVEHEIRPADLDGDDVSVSLERVPELLEASISEGRLRVSAPDRPGPQGTYESVVLRLFDGRDHEILTVPVQLQDVDHPAQVVWDLGTSEAEVFQSEPNTALLRLTDRGGIDARIKVEDPDEPGITAGIALLPSDGLGSSVPTLREADGTFRLLWRQPGRSGLGPRNLGFEIRPETGDPWIMNVRVQVLNRLRPPTDGGRTPLDRALDWLRRHQLDDGSFPMIGRDFARFSEDVDDWGAGNPVHRVGITALAAIAALRAGDGSPWVRRSIESLVAAQEETGRIAGLAEGPWIYHHAMATEALCLGVHLLGEANWVRPAQGAINFLEVARNPGERGGWRYGIKPGNSDTSITTWAVRALFAGRMAGLQVDMDSVRGGLGFLEAMIGDQGRIGYQDPGGFPERPGNEARRFPRQLSEATTAAALSVLILGPDGGVEQPGRQGYRLVLACPPAWDLMGRDVAGLVARLSVDEKKRREELSPIDFYYWQHATALFRNWSVVTKGRNIHQRSDWKSFETFLEKRQRNSGDAKGSFDPDDPWSPEGGRSYATAMLALALANLEFQDPWVSELP